MRRLIMPAAVWEDELPEPHPCTLCGVPANFTYTTDASEESNEPYCSLRHWADKADRDVQITGQMAFEPGRYSDPPFQERMWTTVATRWPVQGPPGVTATTNAAGHDVLLYRGEGGRLVGALSRTAGGQLNVIVAPKERGKGIGRALVRAAGRRWPIDLAVQRMTPAGYRLVRHIDPRSPS